MLTPFLALLSSVPQPAQTFMELFSRTFIDAFLWGTPRKKSTFLHLRPKHERLSHRKNRAAAELQRFLYNLQVCECLSRSEGGWVINVCSSQDLSVHVSGKGKNRTFHILQVTSYFSQPGVRNLIVSKLGNLCFFPNGIPAVINPLLRCVFPEEGVCNQQD